MELLIVLGLSAISVVLRAVVSRLLYRRRLDRYVVGIEDGRAMEGEEGDSDLCVLDGGAEASERTAEASGRVGRIVLGWGERRAGGRVVLEPVFWEPEALGNPHLLILGESGSGKTQTCRLLAWELGRRGLSVLVIDFSGDQWVEGEACYRLVPHGVWGINPLEIHRDPRGGGPDAQRHLVVRAVAEAFAPFGVVQAAVLNEAVARAYRRRGVTEDPATWEGRMPTMADVRRELEMMAAERRGGPSGGRKAVKREGEKKRRGRMPEEHLLAKLAPLFDLKVFEGRSVDVLSERRGVVRVDVSKLPWELQRMVAEVVLGQIFRRAMLGGERAGVERYVVIDEAKLVMPRRVSAPWAIVNRFVSEGRKYGLGVIMATQSAEHISGDVRRNVFAKLLLKHDVTEIGVTARRFRVDGGLLQMLDGPGVGLYVVGGRVVRIRVRGYDFREVGG
mgnify:CR=1 FL=1